MRAASSHTGRVTVAQEIEVFALNNSAMTSAGDEELKLALEALTASIPIITSSKVADARAGKYIIAHIEIREAANLAGPGRLSRYPPAGTRTTPRGAPAATPRPRQQTASRPCLRVRGRRAVVKDVGVPPPK